MECTLTNNIKILSYYTIGTDYEKEKDKLLASLKAVGIKNFLMVGVPDRHHWQRNVQWRPQVILAELNRYGCDLLVVDADATFHRQPDWEFLNSLDCDIAAHIMDKRYWGQNTAKRNYSLMAGTLFVPYGEQSLELMYRWQIACAKSLGLTWDMRLLEDVLGFDCQSGLSHGDYVVGELPVEYCAIDRTMHSITKPIIRHHQASRRLRKKI